MSRRRRERLELNSEINVVNLIDVMLLLLVVFMITAPMMTGGLDIRLPPANARPLETRSGLTVSITREGRILVDETPMSFEEFRTVFQAMASERGQQGLYLRADAGVQYGLVVRVLATMRAAGVGDVGLMTEPEEISP
ncbi:MAG: biopolymer transporter ExbD [Gemmatimonadaceae bacterium]